MSQASADQCKQAAQPSHLLARVLMLACLVHASLTGGAWPVAEDDSAESVEVVENLLESYFMEVSRAPSSCPLLVGGGGLGKGCFWECGHLCLRSVIGTVSVAVLLPPAMQCSRRA